MRGVEFYPRRPETVELRQTHISWVFLAGDRVYKVKKPVHFAFVDYSTLEQRRFYCQEEVRLNRRLAEPIYLGVRAIVRRGEGFAFGGDEEPSTVQDYAVEMLRLDDASTLERRIESDLASIADVERIADRLAAFHVECSTRHADRYGSVDAIDAMVRENSRELEDFVADVITAAELEALRQDAVEFVERNRGLLAARIGAGRIREGHGDLRAEHISLGDEILVFDCVEFSERLRTCDLASEIAFLAMDLDRLGAPDLGEHLAVRFAERMSDPDLATLLPFYKAYRALVRGKVESLKSRDAEVPAPGRAEARNRARRYFRLARRYSREPPAPALIVVCGLSATGKSTVAAQLSDLSGFAVASSDPVRKKLAAGRIDGADLYDATMTERTYEALAEQARQSIRGGRGMILDATFQTRVHRQLAVAVASEVAVPIVFVECLASQAEVARRFEERRRLVDHPSDATWEIHLRQRERFEPLSEIPPQTHVPLDTSRPEPEVSRDLDELLERFRPRNDPTR